MRSPKIAGLTLVATFAFAAHASSASAELSHAVAPGETLWSIAASNNLTTRTVAAYNGVSEDADVVAGQTIEVPTVAEGAAALASASTAPTAAPATAPAASTSTTAVSLPNPPAPGMGHIPSRWGPLHLTPAAADAWNAMHAEALRVYGVDLQPGGPMSAYRTYDQQAQLYDLFLAGEGAPANPPGTSSHELGTAVDVATPEMRSIIDAIGAKFGWSKVHAPDEWWHVDYVGG
jgi:LAS superfamily LD-carboxypeptidase LdcB